MLRKQTATHIELVQRSGNLGFFWILWVVLRLINFVESAELQSMEWTNSDDFFIFPVDVY